MNKAEFTNRVSGLKYEAISEKDWSTINTVYAYHPMISDVNGKEEIATLYKQGGMGILNDMFPTAKQIRVNESLIQKNSVALEILKKNQKVEMDALIAEHHRKVQDIINQNIAAKQNLIKIVTDYK